MTSKRLSIVILSLALAGFSPLSVFPKLVWADEIVISGNGSGADSEVSVQAQQNTTVQQSNTANVDNAVTTQATSGDNHANDNNGNVSIQTGDVSTSTSVSNQANSSVVDTGACCSKSDSSITVSGNGTDSVNTVNASTTTTVSSTTKQTATITNTVRGTATTGNNKASDNQGNVTIITGNITQNETIRTGPLNTSSVTLGTSDPNFAVKIKGNGSGSLNNVTVNNSESIVSTISNTANVFNDSFWNLLTGGNIANRNNGDVTIRTGDIMANVSITTTANQSTFKKECCENNSPTPTPPTPTPTNNPGGNNNSGGGNGGSSSGGGSGSGSGSSTAAAGAVLPATGGGFMLLLVIGNIIMLFFGVLLRLRSGRSPGFRYNFVL